MSEVKEAVGVISRITKLTSKKINTKVGESEIYNIGIRLGADEWHNISEFNKEEALKKIETFSIGDKVKIYEEDRSGKGFFNVKALVHMLEVGGEEHIPIQSKMTKDINEDPAFFGCILNNAIKVTIATRENNKQVDIDKIKENFETLWDLAKELRFKKLET